MTWRKRSRSSARSIDSGEVPMMGTPAASSARARFRGVWPPNWTMTPMGWIAFADIEHVFDRQRLEEEAVGGVVVGRDGFGVRVDHDDFVAVFLEGEGGLAAAVVELDALADAVGAAAEDDDAGLFADAGLVFFLVGRVVVGREGLELGRAGIDQLEDGLDAAAVSFAADLLLAGAPGVGELAVGEAVALGLAQQVGADAVEAAGCADAGLRARPVSCMLCRNQGSIEVRRWISSISMPARRA